MIEDLIKKNRSYRRFHQDVSLDNDKLKALVNLARLSASGGNLQPLKFIISCDKQKNATIFSNLSWAGYLKDWSGPAEGERPAGYILILGDTLIRESFGCDHGIAAQSILLGATEMGFGGCIMSSVDRAGLRKSLKIPSHLEILLVLALGKPKEDVRVEPVGPEGDTKYWRDSENVHHVPKRALEDIILKFD
ncbi:nitroreductase family protein [[Eubacterium] cellulosolvens]